MLVILGSCVNAQALPCVEQSLPGFTICTPRGWALTQGGIDSVAGRFSAQNLVVSFDFGLHSDPLPLPKDASNATESSVTIGSRKTRQVSYALTQAGKPAAHYLGIHTPALGSTSMGSLKLTMLAESADASRLREAATAFATIQFKVLSKP